MPLRNVSLDELTIADEGPFKKVGVYRDLKEAVRRSGHRFLVPAEGSHVSWDRATFLNLTFWSGDESADVLCEEQIPADVIAHIGWHHVAGRRLAEAAGGGAPSARAMLFGEAIASAFDLYLVGRLGENAPDSDFIATQVPIMAEAAEQAGLSETAFGQLLADVAANPERAFEDLRALLVDATAALVGCRDAAAAHAALEGFDGHRFAPLLHHYQLSNWVLYTRAYAAAAPGWDEAVGEADAALRVAPDALGWLTDNWLRGLA